MSHKAVDWALEQTAVSGSAKAILIVLAHRFNEIRGAAYPGLARLAEDAGVSRQTVVSRLRDLETAGLVAIEKRAGRGAGRLTNLYHLPTYQPCQAKSEDLTLPSRGQSQILNSAKSNSQGAKSKSQGAKSEDLTQRGRGTGIRTVGGRGKASPGNEQGGPRRQPEFEDMTRACQKAGIRGSNWQGICEVIREDFDFELSEKQTRVISRQLHDRSGE